MAINFLILSLLAFASSSEYSELESPSEPELEPDSESEPELEPDPDPELEPEELSEPEPSSSDSLADFTFFFYGVCFGFTLFYVLC